MNRVCVFAGSSPGARATYAEAARALGGTLVRRELGLVYGGGNIGLMGILADEVLGAGGHMIGVIAHALRAKEVGHEGLSELRVVDTTHERKAQMAELADGFIWKPRPSGLHVTSTSSTPPRRPARR